MPANYNLKNISRWEIEGDLEKYKDFHEDERVKAVIKRLTDRTQDFSIEDETVKKNIKSLQETDIGLSEYKLGDLLKFMARQILLRESVRSFLEVLGFTQSVDKPIKYITDEKYHHTNRYKSIEENIKKL